MIRRSKEYFKTAEPEVVEVGGKKLQVQRLTGWDNVMSYPTDEGQKDDYIYTVRSNRYTIAMQEIVKSKFGNNVPEIYQPHILLPRVMDLAKSCFVGVIDTEDLSLGNNRGLKAFVELSKIGGAFSRKFEMSGMYQKLGFEQDGSEYNELYHRLGGFGVRSLIDSKNILNIQKSTKE